MNELVMAALLEIARRKARKELLRKVILATFKTGPKKKNRVGRGIVHQRLATVMNEERSNEFCTEVRAVLKEMGVRAMTSQGTYYYDGLSPLETKE